MYSYFYCVIIFSNRCNICYFNWPCCFDRNSRLFFIHVISSVFSINISTNVVSIKTILCRVSSRGGGEGGHLPPFAIILPPLGIYGVIFNKCIITTQVMNTTLLIQQSFYLFYSICQLLHQDHPLIVYLETLLLFSLN